MGILNIFKGLNKGNTLYYPGCLSKTVLKAEVENYKKILTEIGVEFIMLPNELCCGSPVINAGYESDARTLAKKNFKIFKEHNIKKIITNCPACYKTFKEDYPKLVPGWNIEVEHTVTTILRYMRKKDIDYDKRERVTYHDPCHLGRHSGMYDEPREIIARLGFELIEMKDNRENALCCGGGAGLKTNNPDLAGKISRERIKQAKNITVTRIITPCPLCFAHLDENALKDIEINELSYFVAKGLNLVAEKTEFKKECKLKDEACS